MLILKAIKERFKVKRTPRHNYHNYTMIQGQRGSYSSGWYYVLDGTYIAYIYGGFERVVDVVRV